MIGTTITDSGNGESLVIDCFMKAFSKSNVQVNFSDINQQRGKSKREAISYILNEQHQSQELSNKIYTEFIDLLNHSLKNLTEIEGTKKVFEHLEEKGIKFGLGSGLPMDLIVKIIHNLGWQLNRFDYIGSSDELGKGRPDPIMINDLIFKLKIKDKLKILKIGDTIVDIQEGKNAGVKTAVVLTGTQKRFELEKYDPDYIFTDINEIMKII